MAQEIETGLSKTNSVESFRVGYHECLTESMHFLVEKEGLYSGNSFCVRLMAHLQKHYDRLGRASTSEIHSNVGRTWNGPNLPAENGKDRSQERNEMGVKSEYGVGSDESGYGSLKTDDDNLLDRKVIRVHMVSLVLRVLLVLRVDKVPLDHQASLEKREKLVFLASPVQQAEMDYLVFVVCLEYLDPKEIQGKMV